MKRFILSLDQPYKHQTMRFIRTTMVCVVMICLAFSYRASAQVFIGTEIEYRDNVLEEGFVDYSVYALDYQAIHDYVVSNSPEEFSILLDLDGDYLWNLALYENDIRHETYQEIAMTDEGRKVLPRRPCITYAGYVNENMEDYVRFSISDNLFLGLIHAGDEEFYIEPLSKITGDAPNDYFIVYNTQDVIEKSGVECGHSQVEQYNPYDDEEEVAPAEFREAGLFCDEVDFALAADYLMFVKYGSVQATVDHMLTITAMMEPLYDDFDLDYIVRGTFVPTSSFADPWTSSLSTDDLLPDFTSWGNTGGFGVTHDIGQLWTDRNIEGCGTGSGLVGCAWIGVVCGSSRYNVCEDYTSTMSCLRTLSAHELGHNWDATHTDQIMNASISCSATTWNASNITQINSHIASRTCLTDCFSNCPFSYNFVDFISSGFWEYETSFSITSTGEIDGTADVIYDAGNFIRLSPGFHAAPATGGSFNAIIDGCSEPPAREASDNSSVEDVVEAAVQLQVYPNPFSTITNIQFELIESTMVDVIITDLTGKIVGQPVMAQKMDAGTHTFSWDSQNVAQGTYMLRVVMGDEVQTSVLAVAR